VGRFEISSAAGCSPDAISGSGLPPKDIPFSRRLGIWPTMLSGMAQPSVFSVRCSMFDQALNKMKD
jgi:hypothetical protein